MHDFLDKIENLQPNAYLINHWLEQADAEYV